MTSNPPPKLFRFQSLNINNLIALQQQKLWFSSVDRFNDPFEFFFLDEDGKPQILPRIIRYEHDKDLLERLALNGLAKAEEGPERNPFVLFYGGGQAPPLTEREIALKTGVCCLFEKASFENSMQWGHYGEQHKGFAFSIDTSLASQQFWKVEKTNQPPSICLQDDVCEAYCQVMTTKSNHWEVEKEWRTFSPGATNQLRGQQDGKPWPICEVYFGGRMTGEQKKLIRDTTKGQFDYFDCVYDPANYKINFVKSCFETANEIFL